MKNQNITELEKQKQLIEWLETLLAFAKGEKQWVTSGPWVDESNPLMPFGSGLWLEAESGGPGMPPLSWQNVPDQATASAEPDLHDR